MHILRRLGSTPAQRGSVTGNCPDVFELDDGRFAVIGTDMTSELRDLLPPDAGVAEYERIVVVPRQVLVDAKTDIPDS